MIIAIVGCVAILTIGSLIFNQTYQNHQTNQLIIEKCFDEVGEVVIKKDDTSPLIRCEKK